LSLNQNYNSEFIIFKTEDERFEVETIPNVMRRSVSFNVNKYEPSIPENGFKRAVLNQEV